MNKKSVIAVVVFVVILLVVNGILGYTAGHNGGYDKGYGVGFTEGVEKSNEDFASQFEEYEEEDCRNSPMAFERFITWVTDDTGASLFDFDISYSFYTDDEDIVKDVDVTLHVNKGDIID